MSEKFYQHTGDNQLIYGMPKHMSSSVSLSSGNSTTEGEMKSYWRYHPKPQACDKCQAMKGLWFEEDPGPVHPNCKCEIEEFEAIRVTGRADAIIVPPGVNLEANIAEARRIRKICEMFTLPAYEHLAPSSFLLKCAWVFFNFKDGEKYDYKKDNHPEYEDFGNYHYGLYTKALGLNASFTQAMAGFAQAFSQTSSWGFLRTWFDDPRDTKMIKRGQKYPSK